MKKKYCITIEETISQGFCVEADSPEEAIRSIRQSYRDCQTVVDNYSVEDVKLRCDFCLDDPEDETQSTEWEDM